MKRIGLLLAVALCGLTGCQLFDHDEVPRLQADDDAQKTVVRTVGDVSEFQTAGAIPVSGIGLVWGLEGTGGGTPPGNYRQMAEEYLKKNKIPDPNAWLDSKDQRARANQRRNSGRLAPERPHQHRSDASAWKQGQEPARRHICCQRLW